MLSVEIPLIDRMMSPTLILALVALPPSVSCKDAEKKKKKIPVRKV